MIHGNVCVMLVFILNSSCSLIGQECITCITINNENGLQQLILGNYKFRMTDLLFLTISTIHLTKKSNTSSPKGNDRSPENKQVFSNSSLVSKRFFQLVKGSKLC